MKFCKLLIYILIISIVLPLAKNLSAIETSIETKISVETSLENRLRKVLTEITATDKIIIIINAELFSEKEKKELKIQPQEKKAVLPGVPVKESIADRKIEDLLAPLDLGETKTMIKKINATVIMDKNVPDEIVAIAKKVTTGLLGIDTTRGDNLVFEKMSFHENVFDWKSLIYPPTVFYVIAIILATLFVFFSLMFLFNPFKIFSRSMIDVFSGLVAAQRERAQSEGLGTQVSAAAALPESAAAASHGAHSPEEKKPFWFVRNEHEKFITNYLNKEDKGDTIAVILNYLPKDMASRIFAGLKPQMQTHVALRLAESKELSQEVVRLLEQEIKAKLDYSLGGEDMLIDLINYSDKQARTDIVSNLINRNPELGTRISELVFGFEDIMTLDNDSIQTIVRHVNLPIFSQILKTMPDDFKKKILASLPEATSKRMTQEMEMGRQISQKRIDLEKRKILETMHHLQQEGMIRMKHN